MIRQRVRAGLARAVQQGKQLGRPRIDPATEKRIQTRLRAGTGIIKAARECGGGVGTVQWVNAEMEGSRPFEPASAAAYRNSYLRRQPIEVREALSADLSPKVLSIRVHRGERT